MSTALDFRPTDRLMTRLSDLFELPDLFGRFERGGAHPIRIEEEQTAEELIIRAEMPGIDPDKDVDIEVVDNMLRVRAERREEERTEKDGMVSSEFRYGTFVRAITVPRGTTADSVKAAYKDGILEIRVPIPKPVEPVAAKVPVIRG